MHKEAFSPFPQHAITEPVQLESLNWKMILEQESTPEPFGIEITPIALQDYGEGVMLQITGGSGINPLNVDFCTTIGDTFKLDSAGHAIIHADGTLEKKYPVGTTANCLTEMGTFNNSPLTDTLFFRSVPGSNDTQVYVGDTPIDIFDVFYAVHAAPKITMPTAIPTSTQIEPTITMTPENTPVALMQWYNELPLTQQQRENNSQICVGAIAVVLFVVPIWSMAKMLFRPRRG